MTSVFKRQIWGQVYMIVRKRISINDHVRGQIYDQILRQVSDQVSLNNLHSGQIVQIRNQILWQIWNNSNFDPSPTTSVIN